MWICGPEALACCLVIAGRGAGRGSRVTLKGKSRPFGLLMIGAVVALLAGCSASDGATGTSTAPSSSSSLSSTSPTVTSTSLPASAVPSSVTETKPSVPTATSPWPADLTPDQVAAAQAAIAAYGAYWKVLDQAGADPGQDWSGLVATVSTGPEMDGVLEYLKQTAARGQRVTGSTRFEPMVTKVDSGVVEMTVCVDKTYTDFFNADDVSIKAPDAPGSYFRHISTAQVAQFGEQWLVSLTSDDWSKTC